MPLKAKMRTCKKCRRKYEDRIRQYICCPECVKKIIDDELKLRIANYNPEKKSSINGIKNWRNTVFNIMLMKYRYRPVKS